MIINPYAFGAAGFTPLDLPNLNAWWDASDTSTITESGGDVSQWDDKSGNGYHLVQGVAASQPATGANTINGLNVLTFDGSDDFLQIGTTDLGRNVSGATVYVVFAHVTNPITQQVLVLVSNGLTSGNARLYLTTGSPAPQRTRTGGRTLDADSFASITGSQAIGTSWQTYTAVFDYANTDLYSYIGDTLDGSSSSYHTATTTSDTESLSSGVGASPTGVARFGGDIAEILIYHDAHDATERAQMWDYLNAKWGL